MTQTQSNKNVSPAGNVVSPTTPAAAVAKPADVKPVDTKPADVKPPEGSQADVGDAAGSDAEKREKKKFFVVVGQIHEFESAAQAEKFLNSDEAPEGDYAVLRGTRSRTNTRISLR
jgi:hypothetical protein